MKNKTNLAMAIGQALFCCMAMIASAQQPPSIVIPGPPITPPGPPSGCIDECIERALIHEEYVLTDNEVTNEIESCTVINSDAEWDSFCVDNSLTNCRDFEATFFDMRSIVVVAINTKIPDACQHESHPDLLSVLQRGSSPASGTTTTTSLRG